MHTLFEIHVASGADPAQVLSVEVIRDAKVKLLTWDEARALGFANLPPPPEGKVVRYLAATTGRDAKWLHHVLEHSPLVTSMRTYDVA